MLQCGFSKSISVFVSAVETSIRSQTFSPWGLDKLCFSVSDGQSKKGWRSCKEYCRRTPVLKRTYYAKGSMFAILFLGCTRKDLGFRFMISFISWCAVEANEFVSRWGRGWGWGGREGFCEAMASTAARRCVWTASITAVFPVCFFTEWTSI